MTGLRKLIEQIVTGMTGQAGENEQARRVISMVLGKDVAQVDVTDALDAQTAINHLQSGRCLVNMYGYKNTPENRDFWLDYEQQNLANAIRELAS